MMGGVTVQDGPTAAGVAVLTGASLALTVTALALAVGISAAGWVRAQLRWPRR